MTEHEIQQRSILALSSGDSRLWRNNVGVGWQGADPLGRRSAAPVDRFNLAEMKAALRPGDIVLRAPRPLHAGLCLHSSDSIGLASVEVSPEMVGRRVGLFAAVEFKAPAGSCDRQRMANQATFIRTVRQLGGLGGFARSIDDARNILAGGDGWATSEAQGFPPTVLGR